MPALEWYKILFMTELLISAVLFTFRLPKRSHFYLRAFGVISLCYLKAFLYPIYAYTGWYLSLMFVIMFTVVFASLLFLYRISVIHALFCAITAYTVQHFAYEIFQILNLPLRMQSDVDFNLYGRNPLDFQNYPATSLLYCMIYAFIYLVVYVASYLVVGKKINRNEGIQLKSITLVFLGAFILLIDIVLNAMVVYMSEFSLGYELVVCVYNILCCILVFYIQISLISAKDMKKEMDSMAQMLHQAQKQYELQKESIKIINLKCHDLRHHMLRFAGNGKMDEDEISEISRAIDIYDGIVKTGNEVLDIILTEKTLLCREKNITLTCMAHCDELDFIREGDLYILFGNVIDNAIEAVTKIEDVEKRCIGINASTYGAMASITVENYFSGELKFDENGLPLTTKKETDYHGFGMQSVESLVNKYKGNLSIVVNRDIFRLNILLSIPKKA